MNDLTALINHPALRGVARLASFSGYIATFLMWVLFIVVCYDVFLRALGISSLWASEVAIYLLIAVGFLGIGATQLEDGHFRVSFLRDALPARIRAVLDVVSACVSLLFAAALTWGAWQAVSFSWSLGFRTSTVLQLPVWALQSLLLAGGGLLFLSLLRDLVLIIRFGSRLRDSKLEEQ